MHPKGIIAGSTLIVAALSGAAALYAVRPWQAPVDRPTTQASESVRILLPPVEEVAIDELTERDMAVLLREDSKADAAEQEPVQDTEIAQHDLPPDAPASLAAAVAAMPPGGEATSGTVQLAAVRFDLAQADRLGGTALDVRKAVRFNGTPAGSATIRVGNGSALFIASGDLRDLLVAAQRSDLADNLSGSGEEAFVGFDEARRFGLGLSYDPLSDQIHISG